MIIKLSGNQKNQVCLPKRTTTIEEIREFLYEVSRVQVQVKETVLKPTE